MPEDTNDSTTTSTENVEKTSQDSPESKGLTADDVRNILTEALEPVNNDISSLKRSTKKAMKTGDKEETSEKTTNDSSFTEEEVETLFYKVNEITKDSEKKLVRDLQKETGMTLPKLLESKYFKSELSELRSEEANAEATSDIKGDKSGGGGKQSAQYWIAKGEYPTREQVSDRKVRGEIRKALAEKQKGTTGGFYNS